MTVVELDERFLFELANPFARQADAIADLLEGHRLFAVKAEPHPNDRAFARFEVIESTKDVGEFVFGFKCGFNAIGGIGGDLGELRILAVEARPLGPQSAGTECVPHEFAMRFGQPQEIAHFVDGGIDSLTTP